MMLKENLAIKFPSCVAVVIGPSLAAQSWILFFFHSTILPEDAGYCVGQG
jgi:hypothetical protein